MGWGVAAICGVSALTSVRAEAHPLAPVGLELRELAAGEVEARFKRALVQPVGARLGPRWPAGCAVAERAVATTDDAVIETLRLRCEGSLVGARVAVDGLAASGVDAVVRVALADGRVHRALLHGDEALVVPAAPRRTEVVRSFARLGVEHLVTGFDHVLFVLALWLLVRSRRALFLAITAFTVGHSLTLTAATLGWLVVTPAITEPAIALSLLVLAAQVAARGRASRGAVGGRRAVEGPAGEGPAGEGPAGEGLARGGRAGRGSALAASPGAGGSGDRLWLWAGAFGLLHGLGFAGALAETGLPEGEIPLALASFNVGIEIAQIGLVIVATLAATAARRVRAVATRLDDRLRFRAPGMVIGALAGMWLVDRLAALL